MSESLERIATDLAAGFRVTPEDGLYLLERADLLELGGLANEVRQRLHPGNRVSFLIDTNPNYTNVCKTACLFCAFHCKAGDPAAYTRSVDQVMADIGAAVAQGATTALLQGGHNPDLPLEYYLELVRETRRRYPHLTPHFFSATEIREMAAGSGFGVREVLRQLGEAGQWTLPGGGAEILSAAVRKRISPKKGTVEQWLDVHRQAHDLGFKSTATMMYGHVEGPADIIEHLEHIRALQDQTGGFTAFIAWSCKAANTPLSKWVTQNAGPNQYLRIVALARVYLDNFPHIQASWFSEGKKVGQVALHFGADDFGGTLLEENVHKSAGFTNTTTLGEVVTLIREAGFEPVQRTTVYDTVKAF